MIDSPGSALYRQERIGKNGRPYILLKFRTMYFNSDKQSLLTVGGNDARITKSGYWMRRFKLDELPQLFNVIIGEMSMVGPRPEVKKYVDLYSKHQREILTVLPGITDLASITYFNENEILAAQTNPEDYYVNVIMPEKIDLNFRYIQNRNIYNYFKIIFNTVKKVLR